MTDNQHHQPELYGENIWLRPIELRDALVLAETSADQGDEALPTKGPPVSEIAFRNWLQGLDESELVWAVCKSDSQEAIGTASIRRIDLQHRTAETGMGLFYPEDRGKGLGTEIKALILDFAFSVIGIHTLRATVDSRNIRSQRALEKSGYTKAGELIADVPLGLGEYADTIVYQIMESDWKRRLAENSAS